MKIKFNGAAQTVTGSQHLIEINGYSLLLECGLFQGRRSEAYEQNRNFKFDPQKIQAVILSHAHFDHSGNLPSLVLSGYDGPIYTTTATTRLGEVMLADSGHIQEEDARMSIKSVPSVDECPVSRCIYPADAERAVQQFYPCATRTPSNLFQV